MMVERRERKKQSATTMDAEGLNERIGCVPMGRVDGCAIDTDEDEVNVGSFRWNRINDEDRLRADGWNVSISMIDAMESLDRSNE